VIHSAVVLALLSLFSAYAFGFRFLQPGFAVLASFFLGLMLTSAVVGMLVCALAFTYGGRSHVAANSIVSVLVLLSGIYYPIEVLPPALKCCSYLIPITYFLEYFRSFYGFPMSCGSPLLLGYSLVTVYLAAASLALAVALHHAKKSGIMLKMSE
jgi:ABC-2 type transport system permease protein